MTCDRCGRRDGRSRVVVTHYVLRSPTDEQDLYLCQRCYREVIGELKKAAKPDRSRLVTRPALDPKTMKPLPDKPDTS